ncbi:MAG TPA: hypothetical protein VMM93_11470 [Vicinamibacterales bacterium]|nr:hypothetical protein [Vicinamibacterales bacterium]
MILFRCFAWNPGAGAAEPDGPLWFARPYQGDGRHDNPEVYGCLYSADRPLSPVVEQLARFRGTALHPSLLSRRGLTLALAELELDNDARLLDLDDPVVLRREGLRPSRVATRDRAVTQPQARRLYDTHENAVGLRWWSVHEASWLNVTLFDRASAELSIRSVHPLAITDSVVAAAAEFCGLAGA